MEYFSQIPEEITLNILIRVPTESVLDCKLVSSNWRNLVRRQSFPKMHTKHHLNHDADSDSGKLGFIALTSLDWRNKKFQYFEYNENYESTAPIDRIRRLNFNLRVGKYSIFIGSSNGLICLVPDLFLEETIYICNPITREYIILPKIKKLRMNDRKTGFGYVSSTNEYKVVTIIDENYINYIQVYIYTLGSGNGWRNLGKFNHGTKVWEKGIFVNGALYWLDYELKMIVPFDLAEEQFCEHLPLPLPPEDDLDDDYELGVLDGCLSFAVLKTVDGALCRDVWLWKKQDDKSLGWSELFRVYDNEPFAITNGYDVLTHGGRLINIHDVQASTLKRIVDFNEHFLKVYAHKNTLVSLKELGEEDTKIMDSVKIGETESHDQPFNQLFGGGDPGYPLINCSIPGHKCSRRADTL